jgi:hypothetical protein
MLLLTAVRRFLVNIIAEQTAPSPVTMVLNWPAALKSPQHYRSPHTVKQRRRHSRLLNALGGHHGVMGDVLDRVPVEPLEGRMRYNPPSRNPITPP